MEVPSVRTERAAALSVVIPAFNEARRLPATLGAVLRFARSAPYEIEVVVVDDGSTDGTAEVAAAVPAHDTELVVVRRTRNGGKGAAVRDGLRRATGDHVLFMDADGSTAIEEVDKLLAVARTGVAVVIGSRYAEPGSVTVHQPWYRIAVSRCGNRLIQRRVLPGVCDTQCGFKLLERTAAHAIAGRLTRTSFSFDIEMLVLARRLGYEVGEVAVSWADVSGTKLRLVRATSQLLRGLRWIERTYGGPAPAPALSPLPSPAAAEPAAPRSLRFPRPAAASDAVEHA
jgi:dolichyl-phosphate beta-glucosyltransferase